MNSNSSPLDRINQVCDAFEDQWRGGARPEIGPNLDGWQGDHRRQLFIYLLELEVDYRRQAGEQPTAEDYEAAFPRYKVEIANVLNRTSEENAAAGQGTQQLPDGAQNADTVVHAPARRSKIDLPREFGNYRIERKLGEGGMGAVFLAHDTKLDRQVAIKAPFLNGDDQAAITRFKRETRLLAALRHPNICPVYEAGEVDGQHFMAMAYIDGRSLGEYLGDGKPLPPGAVAAVMFKLAGAIEDAHNAGIVHRDLKPANIMIDGRNEPLVMDFGLARSHAEHATQLTAPGSLVGSPAFMSPEQVEGDPEQIGPPADIYALGVVMYQMLTGRLPFKAPFAKLLVLILTEEPQKPREINPEIHPALEGICLRAMAKDPANRMTAADLKEALRAHIQNPTQKDTAGLTDTRQPASTTTVSTTVSSTAGASAITRELFDQLEGRLQRRGRIRFFRNSVLALLLLILAGVAGCAAWLWTDAGSVIVKSGDPSVVVTVTRNGHLVDEFRTGDRPASNAYYSGNFTVAVKDPQLTGCSIEQPDFALQRGQLMIVEVQPPVERRVAIFVVTHQGRVSIQTVDEDKIVAALSGLPAGRFTMNRIDLQHGSGDKLTQAVDLIARLPQSPDIWLTGGRSAADNNSLTQLSRLKTLQGLHVKSGKVTAAGLKQLAALPQLRRAAFEDTPLDNSALQALAGAATLNTLSFDGCGISSDGLQQLQQLPALKSLSIARNQLTAEGVAALAGFPALEELSLPGKAELTEEEVVSIAAIKNLRSLNLKGSGVQDPQLLKIASIVTLELLDISDTSVTDNGLVDLQKSKLKEINVNNTQVSQHGVGWVQSVLPGARLDSRFTPGGKPLGVAQAAIQAVEAKQRQQAYVRANNLKPEYQNSLKHTMRLIPPGDFRMGSSDELVAVLNRGLGNTASNHEAPQRKVTITKPFYMGVKEITQAEYKAVTGADPSVTKDPNLPVGMVRWTDAVTFCNLLSKKEGREECYSFSPEVTVNYNATGYRLPTEAEWEYASRGGVESAWHFGGSASEIDQYAWHAGNSGNKLRAGGGKLPNAFGLFDLYGLRLEWCNDYYGASYYAAGEVFDPHGPATGSTRVARGGHHMHPVEACRSAHRRAHSPTVTYPFGGLRIVLPDTTPETP